MSFAYRHSVLIKTAFAVVAAAVMIATLVTYWFGNQVLQAQKENILRRTEMEQINIFLSTLKDAETGQRGFLITGDEAYLQPFDSARAALPQMMEGLRQLSGADASQLEALSQATSLKLAELDQTIELRRTEGPVAGEKVVHSNLGRQTMDTIRLLTARLIDRQVNLLVANEQLIQRVTMIRTMVFIASAVAILSFLSWAYIVIRGAVRAQARSMAQLAERQEELSAQKQLLEVTLASIGDCVIVTDRAGLITFMNPVAEAVTGWRSGEAVGKPTAEVFRIINEESRQPVDSPVDKVLAEGIIVGLANHTLLIRKDGTEVPIDDSGAPIKDGHGQVSGVVLIFRDFSEYKTSEKDLKVAKESAEAASKAKDQFLAMLSHELRTPLTPVLATLELWSASEDLPKSLRDDVRMIQRNVELEARIIDDLLDLTKVARGVLNVTLEDTDLHELLLFLIEMCRSDIQGKQLVVTTQLAATRFTVNTDASRIQQVFWNILRNAAKFTETGGGIAVRTENDETGHVKVFISDSGIGMNEETLARIFRPFEQGDWISKKYGGLGLGMAISRALLELLGGTIVAESKGVGHGSTFIVTLATVSGPTGLDEESTSAAHRRADVLELLIVEDHADTAAALVRLLERRGHRTQVAHTIAAGLELVKAHQFDVILCDLGLPDGTGVDLIQKVRETSNTPALALSGFGMEEDIARCRDAGFNGHLTKPVNFQSLESKIWRVLGNATPLAQSSPAAPAPGSDA